MTDRWTDPDGDRWPITGHVCRGCGLPLNHVLADVGVHPSCWQEVAREPQ